MNIIELAKQAGWDAHHAEFDTRIQTFAKLVAAHEREECAQVCIRMADRCDDLRKAALEVAAENIRARSNTCQALPQND